MKKVISKILCNAITGKIISVVFNYNIPNLKYGFKRYQTPKHYCHDTIRAMIFWGFYEGAEMRLLSTHLPQNIEVVEVGASLGIVSSTIASLLNPGVSLTCVEANTHLVKYIEQNIKRYTRTVNTKVVNAAAAPVSGNKVNIKISKNNTESSIANQTQFAGNFAEVETIRVGDIAANEFTLVCDIEGYEIELILNDATSFNKCTHLFIELHQTKHNNKLYTVDDLKNLIIKNLGFALKVKDGNVFYFTK